MTQENIKYFIKKEDAELVNGIQAEDYLYERQKRALQKLEFAKIEYKVNFDYQETLCQYIKITTKDEKQFTIYFNLCYDEHKNKIFVNEEPSAIISKIAEAIEDYNSKLYDLNNYINYLSREYVKKEIRFYDTTLIYLLNDYDYKYIIDILNSYYKSIANETNILLSVEQLIASLDLLQ